MTANGSDSTNRQPMSGYPNQPQGNQSTPAGQYQQPGPNAPAWPLGQQPPHQFGAGQYPAAPRYPVNQPQPTAWGPYPPANPHAGPGYQQAGYPTGPGGQSGYPNYSGKPPKRGLIIGVVLGVVAVTLAISVYIFSIFLGTPKPLSTPTTTPTTVSSSSTRTPHQPQTVTHSSTPYAPPAPGSDGYYNDDYVSPPAGITIPQPNLGSIDQARNLPSTSKLMSSTFYGPIRCELSPMVTPEMTNEQIRQGTEAFLDCLMRAWDLPIREAGYSLTRPGLLIIDGPVDTPCGTVQSYAGYYCSGDETIYMRTDDRYFPNANGEYIYAFEQTIAHEFGHHVQARVGVLNSSWWVQETEMTGEEANLESRRRELQAQCFNGIAMASMKTSLGLDSADEQAMYEYEHRSEDAEHGTSVTQADWFWAGYTSGGDLGTCNTWLASPSSLN